MRISIRRWTTSDATSSDGRIPLATDLRSAIPVRGVLLCVLVPLYYSTVIIGELIHVQFFDLCMAISQRSLETEYQCPDCSGTLATRYDSLACDDCGYTPRHGAD